MGVALSEILPQSKTTLLARALREGNLDMVINTVAALDHRVWTALAEEVAAVDDA